MAITVTADRTKKLPVAMDGGECTVEIRALRERQRSRAAIVFGRMGRAWERFNASRPPEPKEGEEPPRLSDEQQEEFLGAMADLMDQLIPAAAYGLKSVEGLVDQNGKALVVPEGFEDRQEFLETFFGFQQLMVIAMATVEFNSVLERDAGN